MFRAALTTHNGIYAVFDMHMQELNQAREQLAAVQSRLDSSESHIHAAKATAEVHKQQYEDDLQKLRKAHAQALDRAQADLVAAHDRLHQQVAILSDVRVLSLT